MGAEVRSLKPRSDVAAGPACRDSDVAAGPACRDSNVAVAPRHRRGEGTPPYGHAMSPIIHAIPFTKSAMSAITSSRTWDGVTYSVVSRSPWVGIIR